MIYIRSYSPEEADNLWELFYQTVHTVNRKDYSEQQVNAWAPSDFDRDIWLEKLRMIQPFVAEIDSSIVGYADLQASGLIDHFFCHQDYQGRGVGRALMEYIFYLANERKISRLYSHVSTTAKPFFEHFGFRVVREQVVDIRGHVLNNFLMEKIFSY